ncbi:chorismate lyase / 3-hydroxybenzoate synthase [Gammaproteobacteria bacterium]
MNTPTAGLTLGYRPLAQLEDGQETLLGGFCFDQTVPNPWPFLAIGTPLLGDGVELCEYWRLSTAARTGCRGPIDYRWNESLLFGRLSLDESSFQGGENARPPLQQATFQAYRAIFGLIQTLEFSHLLRFWNYFPRINQISHGLERYRQFNWGRHEAFLSDHRAVTGEVPAACALGCRAEGLNIAFLASHTPPQAIENPRQISAYHYPNQYGPCSPTFSRACLARLGDQNLLLISGTASIVGHQTLHRGDVLAQTREALANIEAVLSVVNRQIHPGYQPDDLYYKIYLRHPGDDERIRPTVTRFTGGSSHLIYLQADICRDDLLIEIEASGVLPRALT